MNRRGKNNSLVAKTPSGLLVLQAQQMPEAVALHHEGVDYTYKQLERMVVRLCGALYAAGLKQGGTLACLDEDRLVTALLFFAAPRLGCRLLPLNPALPETRIRELLLLAGAGLLVGKKPSLQHGINGKASSELLSVALNEQVEVPTVHTKGLTNKETHLLIATSGTQGTQRLVMLSGDNLMRSVQASRRRFPLSASSSWLLCLPLFHVGGVSVLLRCAEVGAKVILHPAFDVRKVLDDLSRHRVTHLSLVPTLLARIRQEDERATSPPSLLAVLLGGASLGSDLERWAEQRKWPLCPTYGLTEASSQIATRFPPVLDREAGNVGQVLGHMEVRIDAKSGRILIRGEGLMQGYLEAGTKPLLPLVDGWFETGDLGQVNERGELVVFGRSDDMLITGGENIHPGAIENQLRMMEGITDVAVTSLPDPEWGDKLVAVYVGTIEESVVEDWSKCHLQGAMRPKLYRKIEALPFGDTGKLQRNLLIQEWLK